MSFKTLPPFQHLNWNPDRKELRSFAVAMLIGFAALGLLTAWRERGVETPSLVLWTVGAVLATASQIPGLGRLAYLAVYIPSSLIGFVVSRVLLTLVFFVVFMPIGLLLRLAGKDLLSLRPDAKPVWQPHPAETERKRYYRQY